MLLALRCGRLRAETADDLVLAGLIGVLFDIYVAGLRIAGSLCAGCLEWTVAMVCGAG